MKRKLFFLLLLMCSLLSLPDKAMAWTSLNLRSSLNRNWEGTNDAQFTQNGDANKWKKEIDVSSLNADFYFRIYVSDGEQQIYPTSDPTEISVGGSTSELNFDANSTNNSWKISNPSSTYSKITIYAEYSSNAWTVRVEGTPKGGGTESNFKLMLGNNSTKGSQVATFTGDHFPYTATYDITTAGIYYFYVNDGTNEYLCGNQSFSNGKDVPIYQYGTPDYGHMIKLEAKTTGTYTFTFNKSEENYYLKCVYPTSTPTPTALPENLKFQSGAENNWASKDMESSNNNKTWTYTLNMSNNNAEEVWFRFVDETNTNSCVLAESDGVLITADGTPHNVAYLKPYSTTKNFKFKTTGATTYTIVAQQVSGDDWSVTITPSAEKKTGYILDCNGASYSPMKNSDVYTFTLPKSAFTSTGLSFSIAKTAGTSTTYLSASNNTFGGHTNTSISDITDTDTEKKIFTYTATPDTDLPSGDITVIYNETNKTLTLNYESQQSVISSSVYFVSPELTNSERWAAFKMSSSRQRGGGAILTTRLSFNLQDFVLDAKHANKTSITYWFEDESGNKYYPSTDNYEFDDPGHTSTNDYAGKNTTYATVTATSSTGTDTPSTKFKLTKGKAKSYTWLLDTSTKKVEYIGNKSYFGYEKEAGAYYLVGNFADADAKVDINPGSKEDRKLMNKYWFKGGRAYTTDPLQADSIVYRVTVPMPAKGWSQLYLAVFSKADIQNWNGSESGKTASWNKAIRPEEQWDYNNNTGLDGTALHGGLFAMGTKRAEQAINPIVSDEYSSYTFSMNVTTSTYKLVFNSNKLYLMGPAVNNNDETGWSSTGEDNAYEMRYVPEEQCYKYLDANGEEQSMKLHAGKKFAFVYNKNFTNVFYDEDDVEPVDLSGTTDSNKEINAYGTASNDKGNYDTQYVNFIKSATSNKSAYDPENVNACTFNLPSGEYTLRLYIRTDPNDAEKTEIYYLIKDRKYPFYWPDADASLMNDYTTFRSFCDYHAVIIPGGIDVFTVDSPNKTNKTVKLTSYTLDANRVLPANTPVLLAKKDVGTRTLTSYVTMEYYSVPNYTATSTTTNQSTSDNLLHGQISRSHIPVSNNDNTLNFLFGYKKLQGDNKVTVGFFTPGAGNCSINTAYLTLSSDFWDEAAQQNTKGFRLVFDDNNETTSVDEIQTVSDNAPAVYYNMQGVRVLNPGKGLYIRNGKKYIIR